MSPTRQSVAFLVLGLALGAGASAAMWALASDRGGQASARELGDDMVQPASFEPILGEPQPAPPLPARPEEPTPVASEPALERAPERSQPAPPAAPEPANGPVEEPVRRPDERPAAEPAPDPVELPAPDPVAIPAPAPRAPEPVESTPPAVDGPTRYRAPAPPPMDRVLLAAGERIPVVLEQPLDSATARPGDRFDVVVEDAFPLGAGHVLEPGTPLRGVVVEAEPARRPQKPGRLLLAVDELLVDGRWHGIEAFLTADGEAIRGRGSHEEDARDIGIGAAAGTLLGAILGGKEGALAGLILGGGGVFLATRGENVELPAGTALIAEVETDLWLGLTRR